MQWAIRNEADLQRLVTPGATTESLYLEFKAALDRGPGAQLELGRDVSQFANTHGGCLLLGVRERLDPITGVRTAVSLDGVNDADRCREEIEAWITNVLVPADFSRAIEQVRVGATTFVAVNVPASRRIVWVADRGQNRLEVVRRTSHGKEYMRPGEIERQWSNTLRSAEIAFHDAFAEAHRMRPQLTAQEVELVGGILRVNQTQGIQVSQLLGGRPTLAGHDASGLTVRFPIDANAHEIRIPFELLSSAWVTPDGVINVLCLAPIIYDVGADALRFDPFGLLRVR